MVISLQDTDVAPAHPYARHAEEPAVLTRSVARNELRCDFRRRICVCSARLGFSNGAASCTNLPRVRPSVVRVRSWRLVRTRDFRRCVVRVSAAAADRCAQSGDPTRTEQGRSHVAARGSEFYRFTESKSPSATCSSTKVQLYSVRRLLFSS